ncbi:3-dehydroquinate synthase [Pyrococcus abyssi]|uniref:3-dehydroquinate synthase n=1 Tax=Pyrococcus abyssi (strain GE5 / Orsay) TaxID=272844 RepID=AROB_PYRAB|nr:3-dehydroquinate synthase [Pyrococcus abyssi]Q9V1H9.2 RecName: Full=3-dehydroquinate synthase; Short=DHQS [Pyrococcus abyssi GE5]CCE69831.1 TPA: 3-dehydroquinate synthase [Pyrococcus abyssi GE5]
MENIIFSPLSSLPSIVEELNPYKIAVLTNDMLKSLWLDKIIELLGGDVFPIVIPDGEEYKTIETAIKIWDELVSFGFTRKSLLIGLGGGVITDIAGFVASTYMRGTLLGFIPTTLLAQVDAAIGGKTGVNFHGKNMIGTFYLPNFVLISTETLSTLPRIELLNGMAEVIKYAILDKNVYRLLQDVKNVEEIRNREDIIRESVNVKVRVVEEDLKESGKRRILNLGHTVGHAIEKLSGYKIKHGFAVSVGLIAAAKLGEKLYNFDSGKVIELVERFNLPTKLPYPPKDIIEAMKLDKKAWYGKIVFVIPVEIGRISIEDVPEELLLQVLGEIR